jgi:hypothetical protein
VLILSTQSTRNFWRLVVLLIRSDLHFQITSSLLIWWLQRLAYLLVANAGLPASRVTPIPLLWNIVLWMYMHLLIGQLSLSHDHRRLTLLILRGCTMLLTIDLKITHLTIWIICIWIEIEFSCLMFRVNFGWVFERLQNLTSRLSMLILMRIRCLYIHSILLGLKLLKKLSIVLLLIIRLGPITVHALSTAVIAPLVLHLLLSAWVKILHSDVFLLRLSLASWVKNIYCFMSVLLFLILDITNIQLVHCQVLMMFKLWLLIISWLHSCRCFILLSHCHVFTPILMRRQTRRLLLIRMLLIKTFAWLPQLVHVLVHIIFVAIIACAAHKIVLLTVVMCLIMWWRVTTARLFILLLTIYLSQWHAIYSESNIQNINN